MPAGEVNEGIMDRIIAHGARLERYTNYQIRQMTTFLVTELEPDLVRQLQRHAGRTWTRRRIEAVRQGTRELVIAAYGQMRRRSRDDLRELAKAEARWNRAMLADVVPQIAFATPSVSVLQEMLRHEPVNGRLVREMFADLPAATLRRVNQQVMLGISEGQGVDQIVRRLVGTRSTPGILNRSYRDVEGFVRTAALGVSNNVRQKVYEANREVIAAVRWVGTLDSRTCEACGFLDGQAFGIEDGPRPPLHISCRCTTCPVLKSWKELGIDLREAPAMTRASLSGQVPGDVTFSQWLRRQSAAIQDDVLGKRKGQLFRAGKVSFRDFIDANDRRRILPLSELEARL